MKAVTFFRQRSIGIHVLNVSIDALKRQKVGIRMAEKGTTSGRINLFGQYVILVSSDCYSLYKCGTSNNGKEWLGSIGYYGTMEQALKGLKKDYARRSLIERGSMSLDDAISIIVRSNNHVASLIQNAFEGVET